MHKNVIRSTDKFSDKTLCQPPPPVYSQRGLSGVFLHSTDLNIGVSIPGLKRAIHILKCWVHFFLSASHNNLPKLIPAHWLLLTQLATLVLTLTNTSLSLTKYLLSLNLAIIIRELRSLRPYLDFKTASTITTFIVHSKLDYCNSRYYNLPQSQIKKTPEHPELSCSCCHRNAKIFSHHSWSEISTLAENKRTH